MVLAETHYTADISLEMLLSVENGRFWNKWMRCLDWNFYRTQEFLFLQ